MLVLGPGLVGVWCAWVAARLDATCLDAQLGEWLGLCLMLGLVLGLALGLGLGLVPCLVRLGWGWWGGGLRQEAQQTKRHIQHYYLGLGWSWVLCWYLGLGLAFGLPLCLCKCLGGGGAARRDAARRDAQLRESRGQNALGLGRCLVLCWCFGFVSGLGLCLGFGLCLPVVSILVLGSGFCF